MLIHEIVHVVQNHDNGTLLNWCGCSLEREREAMTVQRTVAAELNPNGPGYKRDLTEADMVNGVYTPDNWDVGVRHWDQFRERLHNAWPTGPYDPYPYK